jgi:hypothetical protein
LVFEDPPLEVVMVGRQLAALPDVEAKMSIYRARAVAAAMLLVALAAAVSSLALPRPASAQGERPFRMLVLGDSVMWGQGLRPADKFTHQIAAWLAARLNREVPPPQVYAHSGAVLGPLEDAVESQVAPHGEIPSRSPSVFGQVRMLETLPAEERWSVDLVLVNGGLADVGLLNVVALPVFKGGVLETDVIPAIRAAARDLEGPLTDLLERIGSQFPYAQIVAAGYYPFLTTSSPPKESTPLYYPSVSRTPGAQLYNPPFVRGAVPELTPEQIAVLAAQSAAWYEESNGAVQRAVEQANSRLGAPRVYFVRIPFLPEHAYATLTTRLWKYRELDPLYIERFRWARLLKQESDTQFVWANTLYPNALGAQLYRDAIIGQLEKLLPLWNSPPLP